MGEELWKLFSAEADDCEDAEEEPTTYEQYLHKFLEVVPDRNELLEMEKFFVRVQVPGEETGVFLDMMLKMSPVNEYKAVLQVWCQKCGQQPRTFWRSCLHGLFRFYNVSIIKRFLHSEHFTTPPASPPPPSRSPPAPPLPSSSFSCIIS